MTSRIILIGCVKGKHAGVHRARDLYHSTLFDGRRRYAEASGVPWFILSAKHGLLAPDDEIASYDAALKQYSAAARREWSTRVLHQLADVLPESVATVEIHAGKEYRDYGLAAGLRQSGLRVEVPLGDLRFGQQLAWYQRNVPSR